MAGSPLLFRTYQGELGASNTRKTAVYIVALLARGLLLKGRQPETVQSPSGLGQRKCRMNCSGSNREVRRGEGKPPASPDSRIVASKGCKVRSGSIASFRPWFGHFRSVPMNRHSQTAPACRKSATSRHRLNAPGWSSFRCHQRQVCLSCRSSGMVPT
jgi:hypothetical protein